MRTLNDAAGTVDETAILEAQNPGVRVLDALLADGPCDGCRHAPRCAQEQLACDAFAVWSAGRPRSRWQIAPRVPTRERYTMLLIS